MREQCFSGTPSGKSGRPMSFQEQPVSAIAARMRAAVRLGILATEFLRQPVRAAGQGEDAAAGQSDRDP